MFLAFFSSWILVAGKRKRGETVIDKISFQKCVYNKEDWRIGALECCVFFREARVIDVVLNRLDFSIASLFCSGAIFAGISSILAVSGRLSPVCSFREREEPLLLWKARQIVECLVVLRWL